MPDAGSPFLNRPLRTLEQFAAEQELFIKYQREREERENYKAALQFLRELYEREDCSVSIEDEKRMREILRIGGW